MIAQAFAVFFISFVFFVGTLLFFIRHKKRVPYYQVDAQQCVRILECAVANQLLEHDWHVFIGMEVRYDADIESLREQCIQIDELHVISTVERDGRYYMVFSKQGIKQLSALLDEWQHKVDYLA